MAKDQIARVEERDLENPKTMTLMGQEFIMYGNIENPIFLANDVAKLIEYSEDKVGQMLNTVDDDEKLTDTINRGGQGREMWFVTEYGLYELLMQSRKPLAKAFKGEIKSLLHKVRLHGFAERNMKIMKDNLLAIEDAHIIFRNFSGEQTKFNHEGDRNFCVIIDDPAMAERLKADGWNVKPPKERQDGTMTDAYLPVAVSFKYTPPQIVVVTRKNKKVWGEDDVANLDRADIRSVDLTLNPYRWNVQGDTGLKAYLKTMYVVLNEDEFAAKYESIGEDDDLPFDM